MLKEIFAQSLIGSQGPCSALSAAARLTHFLPLCQDDASFFATVNVLYPVNVLNHRGKKGSLASSQPLEDDGFPDNLVAVKQKMVKRGYTEQRRNGK